MKKQVTVTITFTKEELETLCGCLHDSTSYWHKHLQKAQTEPEYFLSESGSRLVLEQRSAIYNQINAIYAETYGEED